MADKPRAIVLGGTVPHIELIKQLRERGYFVILADYYETTVAKPYADKHLQISTLDAEAVYAAAISEGAELVITTSIDQANITACCVMEKLGRHTPYSWETALRITNKGDMKKTMLENSIPTSRYVYFGRGESPAKDIGLTFPVIVKPADSYSSRGVRIAENCEEMTEYLAAAAKISRSGQALAEEYVSGTEASVYCYLTEDKAHILLVLRRARMLDGEDKTIKCYATVSWLDMGAELTADLESCAWRIARAYGLKNTPFYMQVIVKPEGGISVIEFAPRTGGGTSYKTICESTGFNYIGSAIDSFLGIKTNVEYHAPREIYVMNILYARAGVYDRIEGADELLAEGLAETFKPLKAKGAAFTHESASSDRAASMLIKGKSYDEIIDKLDRAFERLEIYGASGERLLRRDMRLTYADK